MEASLVRAVMVWALAAGLGLAQVPVPPGPAAPGAAGPAAAAELSRWRQLFQRLLSGARRLALRAGSRDAVEPGQAKAKSAEIGRTMGEALAALERAPSAGSPEHAAVLAEARRALADWQQIDRGLAGADEAGPGGGGGTGEDEREAGGREQLVLAAERFVATYGRGLQRIVQLVRRSLLKPAQAPLKKKDLPGLRDRILSGYRQAEARVQKAREAARAGESPRAGDPPDPAARAYRRLQQTWRRVQRDFRISRKLAQQLQARFDNLGPPCPGGNCPEPDL